MSREEVQNKSPNANNKLKCIIQNPEETAKSFPNDIDAFLAIISGYKVEECEDDQAFCFEMKRCKVRGVAFGDTVGKKFLFNLFFNLEIFRPSRLFENNWCF